MRSFFNICFFGLLFTSTCLPFFATAQSNELVTEEDIEDLVVLRKSCDNLLLAHDNNKINSQYKQLMSDTEKFLRSISTRDWNYLKSTTDAKDSNVRRCLFEIFKFDQFRPTSNSWIYQLGGGLGLTFATIGIACSYIGCWPFKSKSVSLQNEGEIETPKRKEDPAQSLKKEPHPFDHFDNMGKGKGKGANPQTTCPFTCTELSPPSDVPPVLAAIPTTEPASQASIDDLKKEVDSIKKELSDQPAKIKKRKAEQQLAAAQKKIKQLELQRKRIKREANNLGGKLRNGKKIGDSSNDMSDSSDDMSDSSNSDDDDDDDDDEKPAKKP